MDEKFKEWMNAQKVVSTRVVKGKASPNPELREADSYVANHETL